MALAIALGLLVIARVGALYQDTLDRKVVQSPGIIRVDTAVVTRGSIQQWLAAHGIARAARRETLRFEVPGFDAPGKVILIKKDENGRELREGDTVRGPEAGERRGELLAAVDDQLYVQELKSMEAGLQRARAEVTVATAEFGQAESVLALQRTALERAQSLQRKKLVPQKSLDEAQADFSRAQATLAAAKARLASAQSAVREYAAKRQQVEIALDRTRLYAPFDGVVAHLNLRVGEYVERGDAPEPIVLIDPSVFEITVDLPPWDGSRVREGQTAEVRSDDPARPAQLPHGPGQAALQAVVYSVSPAISETRRMIRVRLRLEADSASMLRDGQYVNARIRIDERPGALLIPFEALVVKGGVSYVFVVDPASGVVAQRRVRLGTQAGAQVEILEGLEEGELIVRQGQHRLGSGVQVQWVRTPHRSPRLAS